MTLCIWRAPFLPHKKEKEFHNLSVIMRQRSFTFYSRHEQDDACYFIDVFKCVWALAKSWFGCHILDGDINPADIYA